MRVHRPRLCAAVADRLAFNGSIIETGTSNYLSGADPRATSLLSESFTGWRSIGFGSTDAFKLAS